MSHRTPNLAAVAVALAFAFPAPAFAADGVPPEALHVTVLPDRYIAAGKPFDDLAGLEAWARPILLRSMWLDSCGPASTRPLLAAVERFHGAYPDGVLVRTAGIAAPECGGAVTASGSARGVQITETDYQGVDAQGRSWMP